MSVQVPTGVRPQITLSTIISRLCTIARVTYLNPYSPIEKHRDVLPHWQQPGSTFLVTWRLKDSIPANLMRTWESERATWFAIHPQPWSDEADREYRKRFSLRFEQWLDNGWGKCILRSQTTRRELEIALHNRDHKDYILSAYVIMPNHVHAIGTLGPNAKLQDVIRCWKGISARSINALRKRTGSVWQASYWDRMIRDAAHHLRCREYLRKNPVKAGLKQNEYIHWETEFSSFWD